MYGFNILTREEYVVKSKNINNNDDGDKLNLVNKVINVLEGVLKYESRGDGFVKTSDGSIVHENNIDKFLENHPHADDDKSKDVPVKEDNDESDVKEDKPKKKARKSHKKRSKRANKKDNDIMVEDKKVVKAEEPIVEEEVPTIAEEVRDRVIAEIREQLREEISEEIDAKVEAIKVDLLDEMGVDKNKEVDEVPKSEEVDEVPKDEEVDKIPVKKTSKVSAKIEEVYEVSDAEDFYTISGRDPITGLKIKK
jgi:hypothetical protein